MSDQSNESIARAWYAAYNRNDIDAVIALCDPSIERLEFPDSPTPKTLSGLDEFRQHLIEGRSSWADGACDPKETFVSGDKVVVLAHVRVRLKDGRLAEGTVADGFAFKNGKIARMNSYMEKANAFAWAGLA